MVIVGGGDGTLSSTIDFFKDHETVFALLPLGTANSFARALGIPLDLAGAVDVIANGVPREIDLGCIDGDYFGNSAAIGLSPQIARTVPHKLKRYLGRAGYALWAGYQSFRFRPFRLIVDDGLTRTIVWTSEVRIANGGFFGGVELVDSARLDSGEIVVQAVTGRAKRNLFWSWFASSLRLRRRDDFNAEFHGTKLRIDTDPPMDVSIDGELAAKAPITVSVAPKAVTIAAPRKVAQTEPSLRGAKGDTAIQTGLLRYARNDGLPQPLQRRPKPLGLRGLRLMVGAGFLHCLGLGALGEVRVGETRGEAVAFLFGGGGPFRKPSLFRV